MQIYDSDTKNLLSIHIILGASNFAKIKIETCPRVGQIGEPSAEQTKMGGIIMLPSRKSDIVSALFTKTSVNNYEKLCYTHVLELKRVITNVMTMYMKSLRNNLKGRKKVGMKRG